MKWKARLSELGLTEETISHGLRAKIKDYYIIERGIVQLEENIQSGRVNQDDVPTAKTDLQELRTDLEDYDIALVKAIETFDKNKDRYAANSKNLKNGGKKATAQPSNQGTQTKAPTPTPTPTVVTPTEEVKEEKKGGNTFGWVLFSIFAGVITLGAVNILKNRD